MKLTYRLSCFAGEASEFVMLDPQDQMKYISVGEAGVWAIRAKDETIWVRVHERNGKPTGKVLWDEGETGEGWQRVSVSALIFFLLLLLLLLLLLSLLLLLLLLLLIRRVMFLLAPFCRAALASCPWAPRPCGP